MTTRAERVYLYRQAFDLLPAYLQQMVQMWLDGELMSDIAVKLAIKPGNTSMSGRARQVESLLYAAEWYCRGVVAARDSQQENFDETTVRAGRRISSSVQQVVEAGD